RTRRAFRRRAKPSAWPKRRTKKAPPPTPTCAMPLRRSLACSPTRPNRCATIGSHARSSITPPARMSCGRRTDMAEKANGSKKRFLRPLILLVIVGGGGTAIWRYQHRAEGYTGGDVVTTGTIEAVHVRLGFKVAGRLAEVPVSEGNTVKAGQLLGRIEPQD